MEEVSYRLIRGFGPSVFKIKIPRESNIKIASDGILGNKYLSVTPIGSNLDEILLNNQEIKEVEDFESIEDQVSKIIFLATQ